MREVQKRQLQFGQVPVDKVWLDPKSRDDIPAVLKGLQHLYKEKQEELFMLLEKHILPGTHRGVGRPGMEMWRILVLGVLKQGLGCDFDRLHNLAKPSRDGAGDAGPQRLRRQDALRASDNCRQRVVDEAGTACGGGATGGGERPRGREKKAWRAVARGGVTRWWWRPTCIIPPIWVYCGMGCGV